MEPAWPHLQSQVEAAQHVSADAMQAWYPHCMSMDLMTVYRFVRRYQDHADRHPVVCSRDSLCERLGCRDKNRQACKGGMRKVQLRLEGADRCYSETSSSALRTQSGPVRRLGGTCGRAGRRPYSGSSCRGLKCTLTRTVLRRLIEHIDVLGGCDQSCQTRTGGELGEVAAVNWAAHKPRISARHKVVILYTRFKTRPKAVLLILGLAQLWRPEEVHRADVCPV